MNKLFLLVSIVFLTLLFSCKNNYDNTEDTYLVVLSMDGFRWDYPNHASTPTLDSIASVGVRAEGLIPAFPSKTFPNHYTMATGLYPDHHGLVNNTFFDPETKTIYRIGDSATRNNPYYYGGEPIWVTAAKAGMKTASFFWVGSELPIGGVQPDYWKQYETRFPFEQRIDTIIYWLNLPVEKRPRLIMWYMHEPDAIGHKYGPDCLETYDMVTYLDSLVGVFCGKINTLPHADRMNLIFTSDHGMAAISEDKVIDLKEIIPADWLEEVVGGNPNYNILAKVGYADSVYNLLQSVENIKAWKNPDVPASLHYGTNPRTLDITVVADIGWSIHWRRNPNYSNSGGTHGFDPAHPDMHAIFYASGPAFKKSWTHPRFENVNLYVLMAELLGLQPAANDGKMENIKEMLN
ncbi:MAG: alkaline phosphatase family protein [Bacteroidales bacterium]|nr:alkaline phosphatase family protein [Bacteroidales bacterium]